MKKIFDLEKALKHGAVTVGGTPVTNLADFRSLVTGVAPPIAGVFNNIPANANEIGLWYACGRHESGDMDLQLRNAPEHVYGYAITRKSKIDGSIIFVTSNIIPTLEKAETSAAKMRSYGMTAEVVKIQIEL